MLDTDTARAKAEEMGLDLVEISPTARPPVCKIMDYGKYKYQQKRNKAAQRKAQHMTELKEVQFRPKTDTHDFNVKSKRVAKFIGQGNKCKVTVIFRGREIIHTDIGKDILVRVAEEHQEIAQVESPPKMERRQMFMILAPMKGAVKKKNDQKSKAPPVEQAIQTDGPQVQKIRTAPKKKTA